MATRYFTSDFHIGSSALIDKSAMRDDVRPFKSLDDMHKGLICALSRLHSDDILIHLGDLACIGKDREWIGVDKQTVKTILDSLPCNKVFIEGNHDISNADSYTCGKLLVDKIGKWIVTLQHYPSTHFKFISVDLPTSIKCKGHNIQINICGHVHSAWKIQYDDDKHVLNINVGLDRNKFRLYSESELVELISQGIDYLQYLDAHDDNISFDTWVSNQAKVKAKESADKRIKSLIWLACNKPELLKTSDKEKLAKLNISQCTS